MACPDRRFRRGVDPARNVERWPRPLNRTEFPGTTVTESPLTSGRYEVLDKQLAQARTKTRFIRSPVLAGYYTQLSHGTLTNTYADREGRTEAQKERRGVDRGGGRAPSWTREETTRWVCRNVEYESRSFSSLAASFSSFSIAYHLAPHSTTVNRSM